MTKEEILNLENLAIAEEVNDLFIHLHAKEGYLIKVDNESSVCIYLPILDKYPIVELINK